LFSQFGDIEARRAKKSKGFEWRQFT